VFCSETFIARSNCLRALRFYPPQLQRRRVMLTNCLLALYGSFGKGGVTAPITARLQVFGPCRCGFLRSFFLELVLQKPGFVGMYIGY
ncbi:MAG: hypothetical protein KDD36_12585, partial [Flavobacteriales bacterium]|nr:hypothetical protein [Flavobacteriales bacterium]